MQQKKKVAHRSSDISWVFICPFLYACSELRLLSTAKYHVQVCEPPTDSCTNTFIPQQATLLHFHRYSDPQDLYYKAEGYKLCCKLHEFPLKKLKRLRNSYLPTELRYSLPFSQHPTSSCCPESM